MAEIKGKLDNRRSRRRKGITGGKFSQGGLQLKHCSDGITGGMTGSIGTVWIEIGGNRRKQDP